MRARLAFTMTSGLKKAVSTLLGLAFGAQALDGENVWWARIAYAGVALDILRRGWADELAEMTSGRPALSDAGPMAKSVVSGKGAVPLQFDAQRVGTLEERVARIHAQMLKGTADPKVYALARAVLNRKCGGSWCVPEKDSVAEVRAIYGEVRSRVRYTWDPTDYDAFQTPGKTLELATGDCDDMVSLLGAMLRSVGYKVRSRVVWTKGFSTWNHIYLLVQLPTTEWMALDATVDKPAGWEVPREIMLHEPRDFDVKE